MPVKLPPGANVNQKVDHPEAKKFLSGNSIYTKLCTSPIVAMPIGALNLTVLIKLPGLAIKFIWQLIQQVKCRWC